VGSNHHHIEPPSPDPSGKHRKQSIQGNAYQESPRSESMGRNVSGMGSFLVNPQTAPQVSRRSQSRQIRLSPKISGATEPTSIHLTPSHESGGDLLYMKRKPKSRMIDCYSYILSTKVHLFSRVMLPLPKVARLMTVEARMTQMCNPHVI